MPRSRRPSRTTRAGARRATGTDSGRRADADLRIRRGHGAGQRVESDPHRHFVECGADLDASAPQNGVPPSTDAVGASYLHSTIPLLTPDSPRRGSAQLPPRRAVPRVRGSRRSGAMPSATERGESSQPWQRRSARPVIPSGRSSVATISFSLWPNSFVRAGNRGSGCGEIGWGGVVWHALVGDAVPRACNPHLCSRFRREAQILTQENLIRSEGAGKRYPRRDESVVDHDASHTESETAVGRGDRPIPRYRRGGRSVFCLATVGLPSPLAPRCDRLEPGVRSDTSHVRARCCPIHSDPVTVRRSVRPLPPGSRRVPVRRNRPGRTFQVAWVNRAA